MSTDIYKAVPALNTLNVNLNDFAPDNLSLEMYKGLLKIGEEFDNTKQTAIFNQTITNLDRADQEYKNTFLSNKDVDFQNGEFREKALTGLNDTVEYKKKLILDTKGLDGAMKQKLYNHLSEKSGSIALGVHSDVLTFETKENIDLTIDMKAKASNLIKNSDINSDRTIYYDSFIDTMNRMKFFGAGTAKFYQDSINELAKAETHGYGSYLNNVIIHSGSYDTIPKKREALNKWLQDNYNDEALNKKVLEITKNSDFTIEEKDFLKGALKENLESQYTKANGEIYNLEVDYYAQVRTEQAMSDAAEKQAQATRDQTRSLELMRAQEKADEMFQSNDLRGINSMMNGYPSTSNDILRESFLIKATGLGMNDLISKGMYVDSLTDKEISELKNSKDVTLKNGNDLYSFYNSDVNGVLKGKNPQQQEMILREMHKKGVFDYNTAKLIQGKDENKKRDIINMQQYMNTGAGFNNMIDTSKLSHNDPLFKVMNEKFKNNPVAQKMFVNYYTGKNQAGELGKGVHLSNGKDFGTSLSVATKNNPELLNDMMRRADYFIQLSAPTNFTKAQYNSNLRDSAADAESGKITNIKTPGTPKNQRLKSQEGSHDTEPVYKKNNGGKSDTPPPKPENAKKNGNSPATKGQQLESIL